MSDCLKENLGFFKFLSQTDSQKQKKSFIEEYYSKPIESTIWSLYHLLTKHCRLSSRTRNTLRKKVGTLKRVAIKGHNYKAKKKVLTQHGKGLLALLPALLSVIGGIFK